MSTEAKDLFMSWSVPILPLQLILLQKGKGMHLPGRLITRAPRESETPRWRMPSS